MGQPFYNKIAKAWHRVTGSTGGPVKKYVLNDLLLAKIGSIDQLSILEVGAGNGYFSRHLTRRKSGDRPTRLVVSDQSTELLRIAQQAFRVPNAEYQELDLCRGLPFAENTFDLVIASMVFNELGPRDFTRSLQRIHHILSSDGRLLAAVLHPSFVQRLKKEGQLSRNGSSLWTMPGKGSLRLPVVPRSEKTYLETFEATGFSVNTEVVEVSEQIVRESPGLRRQLGRPVALVFEARRGAELSAASR